MKRKWIVSALPLLALVALVTPVVAGSANPHFIGSPVIAKSLTTGLSVTWKVAGLGSFTSAAFLTASSVVANYDCVNHGGNIAPGQPVVTQNVVGPTTTIPPSNGQITFTVGIPVPPSPSAGIVCPSHTGSTEWTVMLTSLTYNDVIVHIQQGGVDVLTASLGNIDP